MALSDNQDSHRFCQVVKRTTQVLFWLYIAVMIVRTGIFIKVYSEVEDVEHTEYRGGFGSFLAPFVLDEGGAIAVTIILMLFFAGCLSLNFVLVTLIVRLEKFNKSELKRKARKKVLQLEAQRSFLGKKASRVSQ